MGEMKTYLGFQCSIRDGRDLWFSSFRGDGLFRYDGKRAEYVTNFGETGVKLFSAIERFNQKLYFIPLAAEKIYTYDLETKKKGNIPYENHVIGDFIFSIRYRQCIYMFPSFYQGIMKLNPDTGHTEVIRDWINKDLAKCQLSEEPYFRGDYVREGDTVYIPFCNAHAILEFHLEDGRGIIHNIGNQCYATIANDGNRFWMAPRKGGGIVSWCPDNGEVKEYKNFPTGFKHGAFIGSFYRDGYVWMFPESANMVIKVDTNTGEMVEEVLFTDICNCMWTKHSVWKSAFIYINKMEERLLLFSGKSSEMVLFYPDKNEIERFRIQLPDTAFGGYREEPDVAYLLFRKRKFKERAERGKIFYESEEHSFREYMQDVELDDEKNGHKLEIGEMIYRDIVAKVKDGKESELI